MWGNIGIKKRFNASEIEFTKLKQTIYKKSSVYKIVLTRSEILIAAIRNSVKNIATNAQIDRIDFIFIRALVAITMFDSKNLSQNIVKRKKT